MVTRASNEKIVFERAAELKRLDEAGPAVCVELPFEKFIDMAAFQLGLTNSDFDRVKVIDIWRRAAGEAVSGAASAYFATFM